MSETRRFGAVPSHGTFQGGGQVVIALVALLVGLPASGVGQAIDGGGVPVTGPVQLTVEIQDPASGLARVGVELPAGVIAPGSVLSFTIPDLSRGHARLVSIRASRPLKRDDDRFELTTADEAALTLEYVIDPTFYPPGDPERPSDARSRITAETAVVRTTSLFPHFTPGPGRATVVFRLPDGWTAVTPWPEQDPSVYGLETGWGTTVEYIGLGPFAVETLRQGGSAFRVGISPESTGLDPSRVIAILEAELSVIGAPPPGGDSLWSLVVVPSTFMRGGASGRQSVVQPPDPGVLAHEIFHWWNHGGATLANAAWFREGFTEYYGVKSALAAGAWSEAEATACLADLEAEMRFLERDGPMSLVAAARAYRSDGRSRRLTYAKGALLARLLDRRLMERGLTLDTFMSRALVRSDGRRGTQELVELFDRTFDDLAGVLDRYLTRSERLPALQLGSATGRSGCARYLP